MGNLCGKESKDGFDGPGRTLGSAPAPATKASVPTSASTASKPKPKVGGPARTLGGGDAASDPKPPGTAAADAAEARASKTATGPLQKKLDAEKKMSHNEHLKKAAQEEVQRREADRRAQEAQHR